MGKVDKDKTMKKKIIDESTMKKIINEVKKFPIIYKHGNSETRSKDRVKNAWEAIAKNVGESVEYCQEYWKAVRDKAVKIFKKINDPKPTLDGELKKWPMLEHLLFLNNRTMPETETNSVSSSNDHIKEEMNTSQDSTVKNRVGAKEQSSSNTDIDVRPSTSSTTGISDNPQNKKIKDNSLDNTVTSTCSGKQDNDSTDYFGEYMIKMLRSLPAEKQEKAENEIKKIIDKHDET